MSDSIKELADLNTNARELLEKHSETLKSVKVVADEAKKSVKVVADEAKKSVKVVADEAKESVKVVADEAKLDIKAFDYMEVGKPQLTTNPTKQNAIWLNLQDGSIWVCVDNTLNKNKWVSSVNSVGNISYNTVDIFSDESCIFYAPLKGTDEEFITGNSINYPSCCKLMPDYLDVQDRQLGWIAPNTEIPLKSECTLCFQFMYHNQSSKDDDEENWFNIAGAKDSALFKTSRNKRVINGNLTFSEDVWYQIAVVIKSDKAIIHLVDKRTYKDNTSQITKNMSSFVLYTFIGDLSGGSSCDIFEGRFKNLRIFDRALTDEEIKSLSKEI